MNRQRCVSSAMLAGRWVAYRVASFDLSQCATPALFYGVANGYTLTRARRRALENAHLT
jgi:hypothetical protein